MGCRKGEAGVCRNGSESSESSEPLSQAISVNFPCQVFSPKATYVLSHLIRCSHYKRRCRIRAPCCGEVFDCRHCHNEVKVCLFNWPYFCTFTLMSSVGSCSVYILACLCQCPLMLCFLSMIVNRTQTSGTPRSAMIYLAMQWSRYVFVSSKKFNTASFAVPLVHDACDVSCYIADQLFLTL